MSQYSVYDTSGEIVYLYGLATEEMVIEISDRHGGRIFEGVVNPGSHYIDMTTRLATKKSSININIPDELSLPGTLILNDLPIPSNVKINSTLYVVGDGVLEVDFDFPGTYAIDVSAVNMISLKKQVVIK